MPKRKNKLIASVLLWLPTTPLDGATASKITKMT